MLRGRADFGHRLPDLTGAPGLLPGGERELPRNIGTLADLGHHVGNQLPGSRRQLGRAGRDGIDLTCGNSRALGQPAHFAGHHGKALAMFARPSRFNGRVQGEQIGLSRNLIDHGHALCNFLHHAHQTLHGLCALGRFGRGLIGQLLSLLCLARTVGNRRRHFLHRTRGLFNRRRLLR